MNRPNKGKLTESQKSRLVEAVHAETAALEQQNNARVQELAQEGLGVSPISLLAAQVEVLIHWVAPSEYARARFDRDVQIALSVALDEGNVGRAREQMDLAQAKAQQQREVLEAAAQGRRESGLYVPKEAETRGVVVDEQGEMKVVPKPARPVLAPPPA